MASEYAVDLAADASNWDTQGAGQHAAMVAAGTTGAGVRSGRVSSFGAALQYVAAGGLTGTLKAGRFVQALSLPLYGAYPVVLPTDVVLTHDIGGSQPRRDLIIAEVGLGGVAGNFAKFRIVKGVASAGAAKPTTNWVTPGGAGLDLGIGGWSELAVVLVPASASTLSTITNTVNVTAASGGTIDIPGYYSGFPVNDALISPGTIVMDSTAKRITGVLPSGDLFEPIPLGSNRDFGVWIGTVSAVPATTEVTLGPPIFQAGGSFGPSASILSQDFYLLTDGSTYSIDVSVFCDDPVGFGGQIRLVRSSDDYCLMAVNEDNALYNTGFTHSCVLGSLYPRVTVKIRNMSSGPRNFVTTVTISRRQRNLS